MTDGVRRLAELLAERGLLARDRLGALVAQGPSEDRLLSSLLRDEKVDEHELCAILAERHGNPSVDLAQSCLDLTALELVPRSVAEADLMLPMAVEGERLLLAVVDPTASASLADEVRFVTGRDVSLYAALPPRLREIILAAYQAREEGATKFAGPSLPEDAPLGLTLLQPGGVHGELPIIEDELDVLLLEEDDGEGIELDLDEKPAHQGPKRVLVVDDEPDILRICSRALSAEGYVIDTAADGLEAEQKLSRGPAPHLVLLDAMLPKLHGFELCARIKANPQLRGTPVILMSAVYRGWRYAQDSREAYGADDFMEKPFRLEDLLRRVRERLAAGIEDAAEQKQKGERLVSDGILALQTGDRAGARKALQAATEADPFSFRAYVGLARLLAQEGDHFGAIGAYERAVELKPGLFPALRELAALYLQKGFRRKAAEALEQAIASAPDADTQQTLRTEVLSLL